MHRAVAVLNREWQEFSSQRCGEWAVAEPALAGATDLAAVLAMVRRSPDEVLGALLRLGRDGDQRAHRTVLQAMLGKLVVLCAGRADLLPEAVSELWLAIAEYPLERRPRCIATNLAWAVHRRLPRASPARGLGDLDLPAPAPPAPDAASILREARDLGLIDDRTHHTLWTVYVVGRSSRQAADELHTTPELVRWRCSRALRRLAQQADLLAA